MLFKMFEELQAAQMPYNRTCLRKLCYIYQLDNINTLKTLNCNVGVFPKQYQGKLSKQNYEYKYLKIHVKITLEESTSE